MGNKEKEGCISVKFREIKMKMKDRSERDRSSSLPLYYKIFSDNESPAINSGILVDISKLKI